MNYIRTQEKYYNNIKVHVIDYPEFLYNMMDLNDTLYK